MRFHTVLFDLDGTLVDSGQDIARAVNRTLARLSVPPLPEDEILGFVGDGARRLMERTLHRVGKQGLDEALSMFREDYRKDCLGHTRPYAGVPGLLFRLGRGSVGVVTNKPREFALEILSGLSLLPLVGAVVGGDETARIKPDPEPLRLCLARLSRSASGALMVGDFENDILAGRAAGLSTCGALWGFDGGASFSDATPDFSCRTVRELEEFLFSEV
ncbi:MAG: HAD-IA family hydrolase [Myxococcales bacterium]|nr:HAD-IA family hydrolase [Myxococcales bacterium]